MIPAVRLFGIVLAASLFAGSLLTGCRPFGNRSEPSELFPSDSVSRTIAAKIIPKTLELLKRVEPDAAAFFGSIQLGPDSLIWVGDLSTSSIRRFTLAGEELPPIRSSEIGFPYLAGRSGTSSFVYNVGTETLLRLDGDSIVVRSSLPTRAGGLSLSRFVSILDGYSYVKDTGSLDHATIAVSLLGDVPVRTRLPGKPWRYHGILRAWGERMVGVSSFRPVFYFFDTSGGLDSMSLKGFDSPMLATSRAFELGQVSDPPLMISSFSTIGEQLFVLNVRPGTLRIDEYDAAGTLQQVFQREAPKPESFTPVDLLALPDVAGNLTFYVLSTSADYGALSLEYRSRLDILTNP
ncbi:MAG: hypothetical protein ACC655_01050 [Rhodothermia bacterium]